MNPNTSSNILGVSSLLTVLISLLFFLLTRGPSANVTLELSVFTVLSLSGIVLAIASRKMWFVITGIVLNGVVLVFAYFLLLAMGISEA